jgi:hypothetical protein
MGVDIQSQSSGTLPITTTSTTTGQSQTATQGNSANQSAGTQQDTFSAAQQGAQGQVLGGLGNLLNGGQISSNFGLPKSVWDFAQLQFNQNTAPQLAAQLGAGSMAGVSAQQQMDLGLAATSGQMAWQNGLNAYNIAGDYAFRPQGSTQQSQSKSQSNQLSNTNSTSNTTQTGIDWGGVLGGLQWQVAQNLPAQTFP